MNNEKFVRMAKNRIACQGFLSFKLTNGIAYSLTGRNTLVVFPHKPNACINDFHICRNSSMDFYGFLDLMVYVESNYDSISIVRTNKDQVDRNIIHPLIERVRQELESPLKTSPRYRVHDGRLTKLLNDKTVHSTTDIVIKLRYRHILINNNVPVIKPKQDDNGYKIIVIGVGE